MSFADLNLDPSILRALTDAGYENPTPIQAQSIPEALQGRDIMASAQTGTGKTAAFTLPALNLLATQHPVRSRGPRILVLTPTRELAAQVNDAARKYGKFLRARCISIVGGMPYPLQNKLLSQPLDILVATPGRFIDHLERGRIDLSRLQMLVLDEADRMLDMGFMPDVERICEALPAERQTLLFSATLDGIMDIGKRFLRDPLTIQVAGQKERHANIEQRLHFVDDMNHKNKLLEHLLIAPDVNQTIIFTSTKRHADLLAEDLYAAGHSTAALHGDMTQGARNRTLTKLRHGDVKVLVATDVAARGIDVQGISHVINYDLPKFAEDYVHRIGRTGRANNTGVAISFASNADRHLLRKIEQYTGQKLQAEVIAGFEPKRAARMDDGGDGKRGGRRNGKPQGKGGFRRDDRPGQNKSFGERAAREGSRDAGQREAFGNKPRAPRQTEQKQDKEVNGNSKHYNKDTDFQFARALADEFGQRRPRPAGNNQERFGNPNGNRGNNKPRPAGKSFGDNGGAKRPRSFA
ncbi:DEAD/DEAH box helicase [Methylophilus sp. QUAN]|uniref:DEAD/DEAH box helicase n=1 Tax=Methylophilus sp. QUAN TaxID=2781020 RepID=UPI00188EC6DF|nr:DEAD/DEAH box helicase [Methylophilus sp. QUAN]MBF4990896.1 DEAD/DEAH box helicase [Methylophilus sp. QUAN]